MAVTKPIQETTMSLSDQMKLAASASTLEGAIVRGANRVKRMRAGGPRSALGAIESHGQRAGLRAGGVLQDLSDLYTPGGVGRRIDRADPDAMAAMWNMKTSQETSMTLSEQMKLAKHEPFGGKQAKPFGKKEEKGETKAEEKKEHKKKASLSEQMKVAVVGGAIAGGLGMAAIEAFLRKNPHLYSSLGIEAKHIPKGLAGIGAVGGGALEYAADRQRRGE